MANLMYPRSWPTIKEIPMIVAPLEKRYEYNDIEVTPSVTPPLSNSTPPSESEERETNENSKAISLITPRKLSTKFPITPTSLSTTAIYRTAISKVLNGSSDKLVVVMGPCSIHDPAQALEYAQLLAQLSAEPLISSSLVLVMRAYLEKPRTTVGWKGLLNDPDLDGTFQIDKGLHVSRKLFSDITNMGVPIASELLGVLSPRYLSEFLSLGAIGARTTESQVHRELASGMPFPVGFKNGTDGNIGLAIDAQESATNKHWFAGINSAGNATVIETEGNQDVFVILRGGGGKTNYDPESVAKAKEGLRKRGRRENVMIDCSHGNSSKNHNNQPIVAASVAQQIIAGEKGIIGVMIESYLQAGAQSLPKLGRDNLRKGMSIWEEAKDQFIQQLLEQNVDEHIIHQFLQDKATSENVKASVVALQNDCGKKYGRVDKSGTATPKKWIARVMDNIERFVKIGDSAMKGAPETANLAWFGVRLVLDAVQKNYKLYDFFGMALDIVTEVMVLIRHYDTLYDHRKSFKTKASDILGGLFSHTRNVYAAILDFSYSVGKYIKSGKIAKIGHALKGMLDPDFREFRDKMTMIQQLKNNILESSQGVFQQKTLEELAEVSDGLSSVDRTLSVLPEAVKSFLRFSYDVQEIKQTFDEFSKSTRVKSHYELDLQQFDKNKKQLNPWSDSHATLQTYEKREPGTCEWIFDSKEYTSWRDSVHSNLLRIQGTTGTGKSTLAASIINTLRSQFAESVGCTIQYMFCDSKAAEDADAGQTLMRLENTLIYGLYELSREHDPLLLQKCNEVLNNPKQQKSDRALGTTGKLTEVDTRLKKDSMILGLKAAYAGIAYALGKKVYLIIDAADKLSNSEQAELVSDLGALCAQEEATIHILLLCDPATTLSKELAKKCVPQISIGANNGGDIDLLIKSKLDKIPGLSQSEREEAMQKVREKTGSRIGYVVKAAFPFLEQPFQRPIANYLKALPDNMNEIYDRHVRRLNANYLDLLREALVWTLFADGPITVQEIMDAYSGIYSASDTSHGMHSNVDDRDFLHDEQIRDAGGPFLEVRGNHSVVLQDPKGILEYCLQPNGDAGSNQDINQEICSRCAARLNLSRTLVVSAKNAQLTMAIKCLQHLNSKQFQKKFLPAALNHDSHQESKGVPGTEAKAAEQHKTENGHNVEIVGEDIAPLGDAELSMEAHDGDIATLDVEQGGQEDVPILAADKPDIDMENDNSQGCEDMDDNDAQDSEDMDDNDSQDSEDMDTDGWAQSVADDAAPSGESCRYELVHLFHHVRQAERLWPVEERESNPQWQTLLFELDRFCISDTRAFDGWKREIYPRDFWGWKPLHFAALFGLISLAQVLLQRGADITELTSHGYHTLDIAAFAPFPLDMLRLLLDNKADPNFLVKADYMRPVFHWWVGLTDYDCILELLRHGASCSLTDEAQRSALHFFALCGSDPKVLDLLLDNPDDENHRVSINSIDANGESPLHKLLSRTNIPLDVLKAFIARGADPNAEDKDSERPLYEAAVYGEIEAIKLIIDKKGLMAGEINVVTRRGRTPLRAAAAHGFSTIVESILNLLDPNDKETLDRRDTLKRRSALHCAAFRGHADVVSILLEQGADPDLHDGTGRTALELCQEQWALHGSSQYEASISRLIDAAPEKAAGNKSLSATAAEHGCVSILDKLLRAKANLNEPDRYGWTPLLLARQYRHEQAETFLKNNVPHTGLKPSRWTYTLGDDFITLKQDGLHFIHPGGKRLCLVADHPVPAGLPMFYYEIDILSLKHETKDGEEADKDPETQQPIPSSEISVGSVRKKFPIIALGFSTVEAKLLQFPGWHNFSAPNALSWAYHGDDGGFFTTQNFRSVSQAEKYGFGDTVGCGFDYSNDTIFFTKNGKRIPTYKFEGVRGRLFPILGLHDKLEVMTNFGPHAEKPFKWAPDGQVNKSND
ncbi:MAG: hypothetical protein Q9181_004325 [Wetmoreana brouardii]